MPVRKTIIHLISKEAAIPVPITETTDLYKDVYLDSLSFVCLLIKVEKQYHITYEKYRDPSPRYTLGTPFSEIYGLPVIFSCVLCGLPLLPMVEGFALGAL